MKARFCLLCDAANISTEGKLNILGEFNLLFGSRVPIRHPSMTFVAPIEVAPEFYDQAEDIELRLVDEDGRVVGNPIGLKIAVRREDTQPGEPAMVPFIIQLHDTTLQRYGVYVVELRHRGVTIGSARFRLLQRGDQG